MELPLVENTRPTLQIDFEPNSKPGPRSQIWVHIIGAICGNLLRSCGSTETHTGKMFEGQSRSEAENGSGRSSQGSTW